MNDRTASRVLIPGSERTMPAGATARPAADPGATLRVTVMLRPRTTTVPRLDLSPATQVTRAAFAELRGADRGDALAVEAFAVRSGLLVTSADLARRAIDLEGTIAQMDEAFGVRLHDVTDGNARFRGRSGAITVPAELDGIVTGVFGLDSRPVATPKFRLQPAAHGGVVPLAAAPVAAYTPPELATIYDFPAGVDGTGQTIALIELGGGYADADLRTYFAGLGLATPTIAAVTVGAGANAPTGDPSGPDTEVMLDLEVAGAVAPGAKLVVYFAENTDAGFLAAVTIAIHDTANAPQIVSISWGGPESTWTAQARTNFDAAFADAAMLGISVFCAAGDSGSSDTVADGAAHVDFPAASPHVVACGGTRLVASGTTIASETVWNDGPGGGATGGGVSDVFAQPAYQQAAGVPPSPNVAGFAGRGVPDVAAVADPATGYRIRSDGTERVAGGTSAVAPLFAGLTARLNQSLGRNIGSPNAVFYAHPEAFADVTSGSNGAFAAGPGWDACTGLGSPRGTALLAALKAAPAAK